MNRTLRISFLAFAILLPFFLLAGGSVRTNPPSECSAPDSACGCEDGENGDDVGDGCIKVRLGLGATSPWTGSMACSLKIFADDDAPEIFTAESLHAVLGGYTFKRLGQRNMADGETPAEVVFSHPNGEAVTFVFEEGESWGRPNPGVHRDMDERVLMVDAEGWAVTNAPVYYDLYVGDGTRRRFLATDMTGRLGALVSITDARGVEVSPGQMGVDIVYTPAGVRQFLTPSRLADVTHTPDWQGYDVAVYALGDEIPAKDAATGLYVLPAANPIKTLSLRRENDGKRARVTLAGGGEPKEYVFDYVMGDWSLARPSGVREEKERLVADSQAARITSVVRSASGEQLSRTESNFKWMPWGFAMTNRVEGFGGVTDTTVWTYYTSGDGKGQVKTELRQSGLLTQYAYDAENRLVSETRSGLGMMTERITYSYTTVDPSDTVPPVDTRPRTVVKTLDGVECQRTYYVYSPLTNIVERVGEPGAAYGGTNALRTVTAYWPASGGPGFVPAAAGFVQSVRHEDGRLDLYDYALESNLWTRTITHVHELSPDPVDGRTTRDITVTNARGEDIETRTEALIEGAWRIIARERRAFNAEGKVVRRKNLTGQVTTTAWDCCHKVSETKPDGTITTWDYDVEGRMVASSKLVPLDMTNVTWLTTCREYDGLGRQTATWQTNYAAQVGTPAMRTRYDALGRIAARTDELGNTATTTHGADGLTVTNTAANGATTIHTRNVDGDTLSIAGSAVTPEFHAYGVLPDGTRWSRIVQGETADSPRFTKRYENMLGQMVREERSGFQGALLATVHEYDAYGRLVRTASDGEPATEYAYDTLGNRIATTQLVGTGASPRPPEFRRTSTASSFALIDGSIWLVSTNAAFCSDASIAPLVTSTARQLTGLTAATPARTRSTDLRGNVTENTLRFNAPFSTTIQSPPHAANEQFSVSRYGVELQTVSVSCVTNTFAYDALGRKVATTDGRGNTRRTEFNTVGQQTASIDASGNRTEYAYDPFGNLASETDPLGNATVYEYDLQGRKTYEGGATYPVRYTYDIFGNLATLSTTRDPAANLSTFQPFNLSTASWDTTRWLYDEASGAMTNKLYADGMGPTYDYTPNGHLSRRTWARGIVTQYTYDGWGNLTDTVYSDDTPAVSLSYDAMGRQTEAHDAAGTTTFAYDAYGSLTNETVVGIAGTNAIERCWDEFGRMAGYSLCGSVPLCEVNYEYDAMGHFAAVVLDSHTEPQRHGEFNYAYLPGTDFVSGYTSGDFSRSVTYEPHRDLVAAVTNAFGASPISAFDYGNDAAGRRVSRFDSFDGAATANTFGYNMRSEVTSAAMGTNSYEYAYDPIGNRIESSQNSATNLYSANSLNQYTSISNLCASVPLCESSLAYDADGNMTSDERGWHYAWNGENRMICASNDEVVVTYAYDHRGRMVRREVARTTNSPFSILNSTFVWDNWNIIRETTTNLSTFQPFNFSTSYVWGLDLDGTLQGAGGVGGLLAVIRSDSQTPNSPTHQLFFPAYDVNGNITEYVATNGNVVAHYEYSAFGEPVISSGPLADEFTHQFSTKPYCGVTGFNEYVYRKYRPEIGRWMSRDPFLSNESYMVSTFAENDIYSYVSNNPLSRYDYIGLFNFGAQPFFLVRKTPYGSDGNIEWYDDFYDFAPGTFPLPGEGDSCNVKSDSHFLTRTDTTTFKSISMSINLQFTTNKHKNLIIVWNTCFRNDKSVGYMSECNNSTSCVLYPRLFSQFYGGSYYTIVKIYYLSCEKCKWKRKSDSKTLSYQYSWNGWRIR